MTQNGRKRPCPLSEKNPKTGESLPQNGRKHTLKWEKIQSKFSKAGGVTPPQPPPSRRHWHNLKN